MTTFSHAYESRDLALDRDRAARRRDRIEGRYGPDHPASIEARMILCAMDALAAELDREHAAERQSPYGRAA